MIESAQKWIKHCHFQLNYIQTLFICCKMLKYMNRFKPFHYAHSFEKSVPRYGDKVNNNFVKFKLPTEWSPNAFMYLKGIHTFCNLKDGSVPRYLAWSTNQYLRYNQTFAEAFGD